MYFYWRTVDQYVMPDVKALTPKKTRRLVRSLRLVQRVNGISLQGTFYVNAVKVGSTPDSIPGLFIETLRRKHRRIVNIAFRRALNEVL